VQSIVPAIFDPQVPSPEPEGPRRRKLLTLYTPYNHSQPTYILKDALLFISSFKTVLNFEIFVIACHYRAYGIVIFDEMGDKGLAGCRTVVGTDGPKKWPGSILGNSWRVLI
jgi:hypothetical protein